MSTIIKNDGGTTTFTADEEGMQNFLKITFQDYNVEYKNGKAEFKTIAEAKKAYDYLMEDDYLPSRGYGFTLNGKTIICKIIHLTTETFIDPLDADPGYVKHEEERYNG